MRGLASRCGHNSCRLCCSTRIFYNFPTFLKNNVMNIADVMSMLQGKWYWIDDEGHSSTDKTFVVQDNNITDIVGFGGVTSASLSVTNAGGIVLADGTTTYDYWLIDVPEFGWNHLMTIDQYGMTVITSFYDKQSVNFTHTPPDTTSPPQDPDPFETPRVGG